MDAHEAFLRKMPPTNSPIPYILMQKANVVGLMALAKLGDSKEAEQLYQAAFDSTTEFNSAAGWDGFLRLDYATFLMRMYGSERAQDIRATLAPLSTNVYKQARIAIFLKNIRTGLFDAEKTHHIAALVAMDADFKALLREYGWTESDFSK